MKHFLRAAAAIAAILASAAALPAQTVEQVKEGEFNAVNITNGNFDVSFVPSDKYSVKIVVDELIADFVSSSLRDQAVYVAYDSKNLPKEVKKVYRGPKKIDPVLQVIISAPSLQELYLSDGSTFTGAGALTTDKFDLTLVDNAKVNSLNVIAENVGVLLKKKASAVMDVSASNALTVSTEGSSNARISGKFGSIMTTSAGSSTISLEGASEEIEVKSSETSQTTINSETRKVRIESANSSRVALTGSASEMEINGKNNASVDVRNIKVDEVTIKANSANVTVGPKKKLNLELTGGASCYYDGEPQFTISKIVKSTLAPTGTK